MNKKKRNKKHDTEQLQQEIQREKNQKLINQITATEKINTIVNFTVALIPYLKVLKDGRSNNAETLQEKLSERRLRGIIFLLETFDETMKEERDFIKAQENIKKTFDKMKGESKKEVVEAIEKKVAPVEKKVVPQKIKVPKKNKKVEAIIKKKKI